MAEKTGPVPIRWHGEAAVDGVLPVLLVTLAVEVVALTAGHGLVVRLDASGDLGEEPLLASLHERPGSR
jgi:hypothetical protein